LVACLEHKHRLSQLCCLCAQQFWNDEDAHGKPAPFEPLRADAGKAPRQGLPCACAYPC
jgi:hypothetical protein